MLTNKMRKKIHERSDSMCEAMVPTTGSVYTRCWAKPIEIHHLLTRARGGNILDRVGETYHLIALCPKHHRMSDGGDAYQGGLLIDGYVTSEGRRPIYHGSDPQLRQKYPRDKGNANMP